MDKKLNPCPFCGSVDQIKAITLYGYHYVKCFKCCGYMGRKDRKAEAIELWNKRVTPSSSEAIKALERILLSREDYYNDNLTKFEYIRDINIILVDIHNLKKP